MTDVVKYSYIMLEIEKLDIREKEVIFANEYENIRQFKNISTGHENHYDARFGMAQAIPVAINIGSHPDLRRMLLTGHGVLCLVDGIDAAARSNGQILLFALHLNFVAWKRLAFSGLMEIRALYKENCIDIAALDEELRNEWDRLY